MNKMYQRNSKIEKMLKLIKNDQREIIMQKNLLVLEEEFYHLDSPLYIPKTLSKPKKNRFSKTHESEHVQKSVLLQFDQEATDPAQKFICFCLFGKLISKSEDTSEIDNDVEKERTATKNSICDCF